MDANDSYHVSGTMHVNHAKHVSMRVPISSYPQPLQRYVSWSTHTQVKSKLEKDDRWKLLPNDGERRLVFDDFCKNIAEEQKILAAAAEKQSIEGFK